MYVAKLKSIRILHFIDARWTPPSSQASPAWWDFRLQHLKHRPWAPSSVSSYTTHFRSSSVMKHSIFKGENTLSYWFPLFHHCMLLGYVPKPSQGLSSNFRTSEHWCPEKERGRASKKSNEDYRKEGAKGSTNANLYGFRSLYNSKIVL